VATNELVINRSCYAAVSQPPYVAVPAALVDLFHVNSLDLWPGPARNLAISPGNTCPGYSPTGPPSRLWGTAGARGASSTWGPGAASYFQLDVKATNGSGLSFFDDARNRTPEGVVPDKVLGLDHQTMSAALMYRYHPYRP
jgi:hypothetical protein